MATPDRICENNAWFRICIDAEDVVEKLHWVQRCLGLLRQCGARKLVRCMISDWITSELAGIRDTIIRARYAGMHALANSDRYIMPMWLTTHGFLEYNYTHFRNMRWMPKVTAFGYEHYVQEACRLRRTIRVLRRPASRYLPRDLWQIIIGYISREIRMYACYHPDICEAANGCMDKYIRFTICPSTCRLRRKLRALEQS